MNSTAEVEIEPATLHEAGVRAFAEGRERASWTTEPWNQSRIAHLMARHWLSGYDLAKSDAALVASREGRDVIALPSEYPTAQVAGSYAHISHSGPDRARSDRDEFVGRVHALYDEAMVKAETPAQQRAAKDAAVAFKDEYLRRLQPLIRVRSQTYSGYIAGRAKLNTKQANSRNSALDRALETFYAWEKGAAGEVMQAVLNARSPEQLQAAADTKAAKAAAKLEKDRAFIRKVLEFKPGESFEFLGVIVERVSRDRDGYPSSLTVRSADGEPLMDDKVDLARTLHKGDKAAWRAAVDDCRRNAVPPPVESATARAPSKSRRP